LDYFLTYFCVFRNDCSNFVLLSMKYYRSDILAIFKICKCEKQYALYGARFVEFCVLYGHFVCSWPIEYILFVFPINHQYIQQNALGLQMCYVPLTKPSSLHLILHPAYEHSSIHI
jgi:hypothetical protein